jgi:serine/alanine adding enzyme
VKHPMRVIPFDGNAQRWDAVVERAPEGSYCQLAGWRDVMSDVFGHETLYRVAVDDHGEWQAVLPLVRVRAPVLGHYLVSMPFLNAGGPVGDPDGVFALCDWAVLEARRSGADLLEMRTPSVVRSELRPAARKIAVRLPLGADPDRLFESFPSKLRSQVRRPMRDGMHAAFGPGQRHAFYDVFARTMRALGTPTLPASFFEAVARCFPGRIEFGAVYSETRAVAAGCGIVWRDEIELHWAGALREYGRSAPNMLLYWSFMQRAIGRGVRSFNFGRCTAGSGTHAFKRQWGGADTPLPWLSWSKHGISVPPSPEKPVFKFAAACWRRLPLPLANAFGPRIARCLP